MILHIISSKWLYSEPVASSFGIVYMYPLNDKNLSDKKCIQEHNRSVFHSINANLSDEMNFLGYEINDTNLRPGETFEIIYHWTPLKKIYEDYSGFVHFTNESLVQGTEWWKDIVFAQDHEPAYGIYPTSEWLIGEKISEHCDIRIPQNVLPGIYDIRLGMWNRKTGKFLETNGSYSAPYDRLNVGNITEEIS